jgi:hypothetical protein
MSLTRRQYWRLVRQRAWKLSREHFLWAIPLASAGLVTMLAWALEGGQAAVDDYLKPEAMGFLTLVLIALLMYVVNLFRAAADIHEEQMTAITAAEKQYESRIAALDERLQQLTVAPNALRILFTPGTPPYEELIVQKNRAGRHILAVQKHIFRVRVENTSRNDLENVAVTLSFEPERPGQSNLLLHLMHDNAESEHDYQRWFTLRAFDHQYVDVVTYSPEYDKAGLYHIVQGVDHLLEVGTYDIVLSARANGVLPVEARFTIEVIPTKLLFRLRDTH